MNTISGKIIFTAALTAGGGIILLVRLLIINLNNSYYESFDMSAPREVTVISSYGDIYDRNGFPLVNTDESYTAVINPETADRTAIEPHITDRVKYDSCIDGTALFLCGVDCAELPSVTVIPTKNRYSDDQLCEHIIGYTGIDGGVCGLEKSYNELLRQPKSSVTLSYNVDARGNFLEGGGLGMQWKSGYTTGIAMAIDGEIQSACTAAMKDVEKGACVVMDISTGEICAIVSKPSFDPSHPENSLNSSDAPFINRAFSPYSVGSVFKLVTAGAALEYGISEEYACDCSGSVMIRTTEFGCHRFGGHGIVDMRTAMVESCNPYFICLGRDIPSVFLHDFAQRLGFGKAQLFTADITSASGILPDSKQLLIPEEKANFSFGQGMLTATPLQVTMMTAAIANGGQMPSPVLVHGSTDLTRDYAEAAAVPSFTRVMKKSTADKLRSFMISTMYKENSAAVPEFATGGGKTSTAQTWTYDESGNENLNCWFTGFFPADRPQYAVTVVIEEGISGNVTCGPVFAEIADSVKMRRYADYFTK